jgi:hypothetical protein
MNAPCETAHLRSGLLCGVVGVYGHRIGVVCGTHRATQCTDACLCIERGEREKVKGKPKTGRKSI